MRLKGFFISHNPGGQRMAALSLGDLAFGYLFGKRK